MLSFLAACAGAVSAALQHVPLGKHIVNSGPKSRFLHNNGNGSDIPEGGSIWPTAIYWCFVQVGTPPQDFPVAIDSGSGDLDIAGKGCNGCTTAAPNNAYDPNASSTSAPATPRKFSNTYETCDLTNPTAPCTISGDRYSDMVSLAGFGPVSVELGSIQTQTSNFDQFREIDGVIGFTQGGKANVFSQLVDNGLVDDVWALCMFEGNTSNGTLTIGGVDESLASEPIIYVDDGNGWGFHTVNVVNIVVGASGDGVTEVSTAQWGGTKQQDDTPDPMTVPVSKEAILDTGTNVLLLPPHLLQEVQTAVCNATADNETCAAVWSGDCMDLTDDEVDAFPDIALELDGGLLLKMNSRDYLLRGSPLAEDASQYCIGIKDGGNYFIIGDTTMRHYYLVFDSANGKIGWGAVNKQTCGSH